MYFLIVPWHVVLSLTNIELAVRFPEAEPPLLGRALLSEDVDFVVDRLEEISIRSAQRQDSALGEQGNVRNGPAKIEHYNRRFEKQFKAFKAVSESQGISRTICLVFNLNGGLLYIYNGHY